MIDALAAGHRAFEGRRVAQVSLHTFDIEPFQGFQARSRTNEDAHPLPAREQRAHQVVADVARRTGDQGGHGPIVIRRSLGRGRTFVGCRLEQAAFCLGRHARGLIPLGFALAE